jgi:hypothetical protein
LLRIAKRSDLTMQGNALAALACLFKASREKDAPRNAMIHLGSFA